MRTLITREDAEPLRSILEALGIGCVHIPLVSLHPTLASAPMGTPAWVLVTSSAVARFVPRLAEKIGDARVVAVGKHTADSLEKIGVDVSEVGRSGGLDAFDRVPGEMMDRCWYVGAKAPSAALCAALNKNDVARWSVYENRIPSVAAGLLATESFDSVSFASGSAVHAFVELKGIPGVPVAVLGPTTAQVARTLGVEVQGIAEEPTMESLAAAVAEVSRRSARK